jgi:hypothetical protein
MEYPEDVRYTYNPEKRDIYLWKNQVVVLEEPSWGMIAVTDLRGSYINHYNEYGKEIEQIEKHKIGRVIRPRWDKEVKVWKWVCRGVKHETVHNGPHQRY